MSARAMPCAMAPAWPLVPPPSTRTLMSNFRCVLVTRSGASAASSSTRRPRKASGSFSLTMTRPSPGWMRTRATAFFRRPVPRLNVSANLDVSLRVECERLRLLRRVAVVGAGVNPQPREHIRAQRVALEHAANRVCDGERRVELLRGVERALAQPARVTGVARVLLRRALRAGHLHLGGIDDDHVIAAVQMRRERRLVLAAQHLGHTGRKAAEYLIRGVHHEPVRVLQVSGFRRPGLVFAQFGSFSKSLPLR